MDMSSISSSPTFIQIFLDSSIVSADGDIVDLLGNIFFSQSLNLLNGFNSLTIVVSDLMLTTPLGMGLHP